MGTYARIWLAAALPPLAVGVYLCLVLTPVGVWISLALMTGITVFAAHHQLSLWAATEHVPIATATTIIGASVTGLLAVWGYATFIPALAWIFTVVTVLTLVPIGWSSAAARHLRSRYRRTPLRFITNAASHAPEPDSLPASTHAVELFAIIERQLGPALVLWTDEELCRQWRASYSRLQRASTRAKCAIVLERQLYLDELERRHPDALVAWLDSGARAASDPTRFLPTSDRGFDAPPGDRGDAAA